MLLEIFLLMYIHVKILYNIYTLKYMYLYIIHT